MDHIGCILPKVLNKRGLKDHALASHICFLASEYLLLNVPDIFDEITLFRLKNVV